MKFVCPLITVASIEKSKRFYVDVLQQKIKFDFGENVTFEGDFAIHLDSHFSKLIDNKRISKGENAVELYFEHEEIEELANRLKATGVVFAHELREQPWRQKVVRLYDPDGYIIEVGETMEHVCFRLYNEKMSIEEISMATSMPIEFIKSSIILKSS